VCLSVVTFLFAVSYKIGDMLDLWNRGSMPFYLDLMSRCRHNEMVRSVVD
jgi:hypothetical protein